MTDRFSRDKKVCDSSAGKWLRNGDRTVREGRFLGAPCRRLFQSGAPVRPLPLSVSPADALRSSCREQARARPLARPASQMTQPAVLDAPYPTRPSSGLNPLFKPDAVLAAQTHSLLALLRIFLSLVHRKASGGLRCAGGKRQRVER